jgi:hypothetical protein
MLCVLLQRVPGSEDRYIKPLGARPRLVSNAQSVNYQHETTYVEQPVIDLVVTHLGAPCILSQDDFIWKWTPDIVILKVASNKEESLVRCETPLMNVHAITRHPAALMAILATTTCLECSGL